MSLSLIFGRVLYLSASYYKLTILSKHRLMKDLKSIGQIYISGKVVHKLQLALRGVNTLQNENQIFTRGLYEAWLRKK